MKIRPVGSELFHSDGHDEANSRHSQFCERAEKCGADPRLSCMVS